MKALLTKVVMIATLALLCASALADNGLGLPKYPDRNSEVCVEPTDVMRKQHMTFIMHQRDETMHKGIRGVTAKHSLKDCIHCHVEYDDYGKAIPVNAPDQFCESCHTYTAVSIDCFGCHRTTPSEESQKMSQSMANPHK